MDRDLTADDEPCVITDTHVYSALPIHRWAEALELVVALVGPDVAVPSPNTATLLAARSLSTGAIDAVYFLDTVILADRFAANSGVGVSFTAFHDLIRSLLGANALYYAPVCGTPKARTAAERAGLKIIELLAVPQSALRATADESEGGSDVAQGGTGER